MDEKILPRYGLVHRIDKNTSGLLLMAKTVPGCCLSCKTIF
ncbi:MAG: pseudouridine synthase [Segetibacter sp.]